MSHPDPDEEPQEAPACPECGREECEARSFTGYGHLQPTPGGPDFDVTTHWCPRCGHSWSD